LLRPPRNSKEAIKTLLEADKRYEQSKTSLYGNSGTISFKEDSHLNT
jgi:hypothetical protein